MTRPSDDTLSDALAVLKRLREAGHVAYFGGGCVRDRLLGLTPTDYDIATDAPPDRVRQLFSNTQAVGAAFGVILVRHRQSVIEVATFRTDLKYTDGRRPEGVVFTTAEEDAKRRDFTINGLFDDPVEGKVIDYIGGQEDLKHKILRAIGEPNHRFEEDHLRLLRAVRFAARMDLTIEPITAEAMRGHSEHLQRISPERIGEELRGILTAPTRGRAYALLREFHLLDVIMRFLPEKPSSGTGWAAGVFAALSPPALAGEISFGLALAGLTQDFRLGASGDDEAARLLTPVEIRRSVSAMRKALKISNDEADAMGGAMSFGHLLNEKSPPAVAAMKRFLAKVSAPDARRLMSALAARGRLRRPIETALARLDEIEKQGDVAPAPLITGDDLAAAGLAPGPVYKHALNAAYDAQLEDRITTKEQAMVLALELARDYKSD